MSMEVDAERRLRKSRHDRMIFGVAGGLAEYFDVDPALARLFFVLISLTGGIGMLVYLVLAVVMPGSPGLTSRWTESRPDPTAPTVGMTDDEILGLPLSPATPRKRSRKTGLAILLIAAGLSFLLAEVGWLWWLHPQRIWPLILVGFGLWLLLHQRRPA